MYSFLISLPERDQVTCNQDLVFFPLKNLRFIWYRPMFDQFSLFELRRLKREDKMYAFMCFRRVGA